MVKFRRVNQPLAKFFARYKAWLEFQQLTKGLEAAAAIETSPDAIPCYEPWEMPAIFQDKEPVVALDLREGLRELGYLIALLPQDKHYIIFSGSRSNTIFNCPINMTVIYYDAILHDLIDLHLNTQNLYFYSDRQYYFVYPKPFNFVTFIATAREYRQRFADWLPELGYQNFIFRMHQKDYGISADHLDFVNFSQVEQDLPQWFETQAAHTPTPHYHIIGRIPTHMMNQAYFNLILESDFDSSYLNVTEKTVRSLLLGMPFVVAGAARHLEYLRNMGFRTYNDLWDESYDSETESHVRLRMVFDLCRQLGQFDWNLHRDQLEQIGKHNKANFLDLGSHVSRELQQFDRTIREYASRH